MIPRWVSPYVGVPFADQGGDLVAGCFCWGLVRNVLEREASITGLPTYGECSAADLIAAAREFKTAIDGDLWGRVEEPRKFDVLLMTAMDESPKPRRVPGHCGVMIDAKQVLHIWQATNSVVMGLDHARIRTRKIGFYRHRLLA